MEFETPTPIQEATIPLALAGRDVLGSAQTGTGKTGAFGIPLLARLIENSSETALVLAPTRELATQVMKFLQTLTESSTPVKSVLLIGGESIQTQLHKLKRNPRLFVGTPGRVNDHLRRGTLDLSQTKFFVLDEMDRMLDMGFSIQIEEIRKHLPSDRQTLLFSATLPKNILKLASSYMKNPERVAVGSTSSPVDNVRQVVIQVTDEEKYPKLIHELGEREGTVLIFVKTKINAEKLAKRLKDEEFEADALHGDLRHNKRERVIHSFRNKKYRILVATDVAARGLDIPHIEHVINYDLPQCPEDYIHRIGRTARAGATGDALCLISSSDRKKWNEIHRLIYPGEPEPFSNKRERPNPSPSKRGRFEKDKKGPFSSPRGKSSAASHERSSSPRAKSSASPYERSSSPRAKSSASPYERSSSPRAKSSASPYERSSSPRAKSSASPYERSSSPRGNSPVSPRGKFHPASSRGKSPGGSRNQGR